MQGTVDMGRSVVCFSVVESLQGMAALDIWIFAKLRYNSGAGARMCEVPGGR